MERVNQVVDFEVWKPKQMEQLQKEKMRKERLKDIDDDEHRWLQCNTDPKKTAAIFNLQEKMVETIR